MARDSNGPLTCSCALLIPLRLQMCLEVIWSECVTACHAHGLRPGVAPFVSFAVVVSHKGLNAAFLCAAVSSFSVSIHVVVQNMPIQTLAASEAPLADAAHMWRIHGSWNFVR